MQLEKKKIKKISRYLACFVAIYLFFGTLHAGILSKTLDIPIKEYLFSSNVVYIISSQLSLIVMSLVFTAMLTDKSEM